MKAIKFTADAAVSFGRVFALYAEFILLGVGVIVVLTAMAAPIAGVDSSIYLLHEPLCHQIDERCVAINGAPTALCARCLGGHLAFVLAWGIVRISSRKRKLFIRSAVVFIAIGAADVVLHTIGLYDTGNLYRFISGGLLGTGVGIPTFILARGARYAARRESTSA